jgi:RecJ-like exonuclease
MKSRNASDTLLILLLACIGALWFFGRTRPIEVTERIASDQRGGVCNVCGGAGSVEVPVTCTACGGSGKGAWKLKPTPANQRVDTRPACVMCRGSGKVTGRAPCTACDGTGRAAAGQKRAVATTRAGLSLWEKILKFFHIAPEANPAPQMNKRGGYELVERYVALQPGGAAARA